MQTEVQTKAISGSTYGVYMLPPRTANRMFIRIIKTVGPSLGVLLEELDESDDEAGIKGGLEALMDNPKLNSGAFIGKIAKELCERLNENEIEEMMNTLMKVSEVDGAKMAGVFDAHFMGKIGALYAWFGFALQVQYGNFGDAWTNDSPPSVQAKTGAA